MTDTHGSAPDVSRTPVQAKIQQLMAQAVEKQQSEQQAFAAMLDDLRDRSASHEASLAHLTAVTTSTAQLREKQLEALASRLENVATTSQSLVERAVDHANVPNELSELHRGLATLGLDVNAMQSVIAELRHELSALMATVQALPTAADVAALVREQVRADTSELLADALKASEARVIARVDEGVLALAKAVLRPEKGSTTLYSGSVRA